VVDDPQPRTVVATNLVEGNETIDIALAETRTLYFVSFRRPVTQRQSGKPPSSNSPVTVTANPRPDPSLPRSARTPLLSPSPCRPTGYCRALTVHFTVTRERSANGTGLRQKSLIVRHIPGQPASRSP